MKKIVGCIIVLVLSLMIIGCTVSNVIKALDGVQIATSVASVVVPGLCATGVIPAPLCPIIEGYVSNAGAAAAGAATELSTSDATGVKISAIYDLFAKIVIPRLPPGTDPKVGEILLGIDGSIKAFMAILNPPTSPTFTASAKRSLSEKVIKPTLTERRQLNEIRSKSLEAALRVHRQ